MAARRHAGRKRETGSAFARLLGTAVQSLAQPVLSAVARRFFQSQYHAIRMQIS